MAIDYGDEKDVENCGCGSDRHCFAYCEACRDFYVKPMQKIVFDMPLTHPTPEACDCGECDV